MYIRELYMKNFGKFSEETYLIKDGIHVFYGENESGKSTIYAFIKGMLFGIERGRGRAAKNDAFRQNEPWKNSNYYAGVLKFSVGERNFRLERTFDKVSKSASLICEDDGEELSLEDGDLEMLLDGMTEETFDNTIAVGQLGVETDKSLAITLQNFAANYYATGNSDLNLNRALESLKERRRELDAEKKKEQEERESRREKIIQEQEFVQRDLGNLREELQEVHREEERIRRQVQLEKEQGTDEDTTVSGDRTKIIVTGGVLLVLAMIITFFVLDSPWNYIVPVIILAAAIVAAVFLSQRIGLEPDQKDGYESGNLSKALGKQREKLRWQKSHLKEEIHEKEVYLANLQEQLQEIRDLDDGFQEREKKKEALELASSQIQKLAMQLQKDFGRILNEKASAIMSAVTEGRYTQLFITENHEMFLITKYRRIPIERVSRGTIDQVYFSLRMAAADFLLAEDCPVIFDEAFAFFDENRLQAVLKWLSESKKQVIIFTCQKRELEMLDHLGIPYQMSQIEKKSKE